MKKISTVAAKQSKNFREQKLTIVRRIWSHRYKRWRNGDWKRLPKKTLYREHGLVNLIGLIPSLASRND